MHGIKDRVSEKLSSLFSASPSSPKLDQESEARPSPKNASTLASILPSASFDWFRRNANNGGVSFKRKSKSFSRKDKPLDGYTEHGHDYDKLANVKSHEENGEHVSTVDPNENIISSSSHLKDESFFVSPDLYKFLNSSLPNIVKGCQWVLLYSTVRDGISLRTLIRKSAGLSGYSLLIAGDMQGAVFGGLLDCPLKPTAKRKYQGTNQSFVFTTIYGEPRLFRATGANRYFYMCLNDLLALGGGANFALCLNEDLLSGTSGPCETFGNLCLANVQEFELKNVELWGFAHASQYLN